MTVNDIENKYLRRLLAVLMYIVFFIVITISLISIVIENFFYALKYYLIELREDIKTYYLIPLKDIYNLMLEQFKEDKK